MSERLRNGFARIAERSGLGEVRALHQRLEGVEEAVAENLRLRPGLTRRLDQLERDVLLVAQAQEPDRG